MKQKLTDAKIRALKAKDKAYGVADGGGLSRLAAMQRGEFETRPESSPCQDSDFSSVSSAWHNTLTFGAGKPSLEFRG